MQEQPFEWNSEPGPDLLSRDLQRRTALIVAGGMIGLGSGLFCLVFAGLQGGLVWLAFSVLALAILFLLIRYFELGLVAFLGVCWIAIGTPTLAQGGSGGGAQHLNISQAGLIVLLGIWGMRRLLLWRRGVVEDKLYASPVNIPILLYLVFSVWSTINGILFPNQLVMEHGTKQFVQVNILEALMRILALGGLLLIGNSLQGRMLKAGAIMLLVPGIVTFILFVARVPFFLTDSYLAFAQEIAMGVLAATVLTGTWTRPWVRVVCCLMVLWMLFWWFIKGAEWVSGWLGPLIALTIISYTSQKKLFWAACAFIALIVALNFSYFFHSVYTSNFYGEGSTHDASRIGHMGTFTNDRTRMLGAAVQYATYFPLGVGLGNYRSYESYFGRVDVWNTTVFTSAHGTYAQALTETGWPGFLSLMLLIYASARMLRGYYRVLPPGAAKTYMLGSWGGCIGVFCSAFLGDYLFPTYHNGGMISFGACVYVWFTIGMAIAIARHHGLVWRDIVAAQQAEKNAKPKRIVAPVYNRGPYANRPASAESNTSGRARTATSVAE